MLCFVKISACVCVCVVVAVVYVYEWYYVAMLVSQLLIVCLVCVSVNVCDRV